MDQAKTNRSTQTLISRRIGHLIVCACLAGTAAGCASPPPLDDAQLGKIALASTGDLLRLQEAQMQYGRENLPRITISRGPDGEPITFGPENYEDYLAYIKQHPEKGMTPMGTISIAALSSVQGPEWPIMRLTFRSNRKLFDNSDWLPSVDFYLCDEEAFDRELHGFGWPEIIWQGQFIYPRVSNEIENALEAGLESQEYEVFFEYVYRDHRGTENGKPQRVLLPLPSDLCLSLLSRNHPFGASVGRPLRIDKVLVNAAIGDLPRPVPDL